MGVPPSERGAGFHPQNLGGERKRVLNPFSAANSGYGHKVDGIFVSEYPVGSERKIFGEHPFSPPKQN